MDDECDFSFKTLLPDWMDRWRNTFKCYPTKYKQKDRRKKSFDDKITQIEKRSMNTERNITKQRLRIDKEHIDINKQIDMIKDENDS